MRSGTAQKSPLKLNKLVNSLGPTLGSTIGPPPHGFKTIQLMDVMQAVEDRYGTID